MVWTPDIHYQYPLIHMKIRRTVSSLPRNFDIKIGDVVLIELKDDQGTGKLTEGIVAEKLTPGKL